ncbi:MAG: SUMF1/EgtB/PvdO family nonheme iron enzyme [bacterium]
MNPMIVRICILTALMISAASAAPDRLFYRITANTNTTITSWTPDGTLTWICADTNGSHTIEATSDLGNSSTCFWGTVAYGVNTGLVMACTAPKPDAPFPPEASSVLIPVGDFLMGDIYHTYSFPDSEGPPHTVHTSAYYIDSTEITRSQWDDVVGWATNNGYEFDSISWPDTGTNFPVYDVSWYDSVKWCNARSEKEGFPPVYFTNETWTSVYRLGQYDLGNSNVNWTAHGYRLPTEAEWEKAARGGLYQNHYPWSSPGPTNASSYITATNANYSLDGTGGDSTGTTAVATFSQNGYGLYDMAGNVREWCWDYWDYYPDPAVNDLVDPTGPDSGTERAVRGGSTITQADDLRCSARSNSFPPVANPYYFIGFRCVRSCR